MATVSPFVLLAAPTPTAGLLNALTAQGVVVPPEITTTNLMDMLEIAQSQAARYLTVVGLLHRTGTPMTSEDLNEATYYQIGVGSLGVYVNLLKIPMLGNQLAAMHLSQQDHQD